MQKKYAINSKRLWEKQTFSEIFCFLRTDKSIVTCIEKLE